MSTEDRLIRIENKLDQLRTDVTVLKSEMGFAKRGAIAVLTLCGVVVTWVIAWVKG